MKLISLRPANDNIHKYVARIQDSSGSIKTVKFGAFGMSDYTKHKDPTRKERYLARHREREDWTKEGILTPGFWSRWLLWNLPSIRESLADLKERFDL